MAQSSLEYELLTPLPASSATVRFEGPYNGKTVQWNLQLYTVEAYFFNPAKHVEQVFGKTPRQFIYIGEQGDGMHDITVAMAVPKIDEQTLKKVLIMIRNYKRLRPGWHEWGPVYAQD